MQKNVFEKKFLKLINNAIFEKTMENVRKHRDIKLVTNKARNNYLVPEPKYHTTKFLSEKVLATKMKNYEYSWISPSI